MAAAAGSESTGPCSEGPELEQLCSLQRLRRVAEDEVAALREVLFQTTRGRIKLQLEAAMLIRMREATMENSSTIELALRKEEGDAAVEALEQRTELATYDQHAHVLDVQSLLETDAQTSRAKQLLIEADEYFQEAVAAAQARIKGFQALTQQEAKETREDVEVLKKSLDQHLNKLRETFEKNIEDLQAHCCAELRDLEASLDLRERVAIHEVEERKNCHIDALKKFNEETLGKLQAYYEDITQDNLQLVKKLRSENERTMANNRRLRKEIDAVSANNEKLREPLQQQEALKARLKSQLRFVEKDKLVLRNLRRRNEQMEERVKVVRSDVRTLDSQKKAVRHSIGQLQQRLRQLSEESSTGAAAQGAILRLHALETLGLLSLKFRQINSLTLGTISTHAPSLESAPAICEVVRDTISEQNESEKELKQQLRENIASYNDMLLFMHARLQALGVSHCAIPAKPLSHGEAIYAADEGLDGAFKANKENARQQSDTTTKQMPLTALVDHRKTTEETSTNQLKTARTAAVARPMAIVEGSTQLPGWTVTWPCAKATGALHLNAKPLQRFLKTIVNSGNLN
ncbi:hypothetical protein Esti_005250 [Eimeria stiedai]